MERHIMTRVMRRRVWVAALVLFLLLLCGTLLYQLTEGWGWIDSLYFTTATITTVGYGDLVPTHDISKLITIFYCFVGIGAFLYLVSTVGVDFIPPTQKTTRFSAWINAVFCFGRDVVPPRQGGVGLHSLSGREAFASVRRRKN